MEEWYNFKWLKINTLQAFEWANYQFLYLVLTIPLLFFLKWVFASQNKQKFILTVGNVSPQTSFLTWFRFLIPLFFVLGMLFTILALARPQLLNPSKQQYGEGIDIALAIDISDSMLATDLNPNRLGAAKTIAIDFIRGRQNDRIALVAFAGETTTLSPLTTDYSMLTHYLASLNPSLIKTAGTAIGLALASCINKLRDVPGKSKIAILISDGDNTAGEIDPNIALELAQTFGIRLYTIAVGRDDKLNKIDEKTLKMLATGANGKFYRANDNTALSEIFKEIDKLEKSKLIDNPIRDVSDYYYIYLNWAIFFFLTAFALKNTFMGNLLED
jgi:Ca-activated chloride channel homolog